LIAVGTYKGFTQIWDVAANKKVNNLHGHTARVGEFVYLLLLTWIVVASVVSTDVSCSVTHQM